MCQCRKNVITRSWATALLFATTALRNVFTADNPRQHNTYGLQLVGVKIRQKFCGYSESLSIVNYCL
jgi:hypothetical protein